MVEPVETDPETGAEMRVDLAADFRESGVADILDELDRDLTGTKTSRPRA